MIGSISLDNEGELSQAKSRLLNSDVEESWLLLDYKTPKELHFSASGTNLDELRSHLDEDKIQYVLARVNKRNYLINTVGDKVGMLDKGKNKLHKSHIEEYLKPYEIAYTETQFSKINKNDIIRFH